MLRDYTVGSLEKRNQIEGNDFGEKEEIETELGNDDEKEEDLADIYDDQIVNDSNIPTTPNRPLFKKQQSTFSMLAGETVYFLDIL